MAGKAKKLATVRCVSTHTEDLDDGRSVPVGEYAKGVDAESPGNARLLSEGRIIETTEASADAAAEAVDPENKNEEVQD